MPLPASCGFMAMSVLFGLVRTEIFASGFSRSALSGAGLFVSSGVCHAHHAMRAIEVESETVAVVFEIELSAASALFETYTQFATYAITGTHGLYADKIVS